MEKEKDMIDIGKKMDIILKFLERNFLANGKIFPINAVDRKVLLNIPHQRNNSDCGVFVLKMIQYLCNQKPLHFSSKHIPYFRRLMVLELFKFQLICPVPSFQKQSSQQEPMLVDLENMVAGML